MLREKEKTKNPLTISEEAEVTIYDFPIDNMFSFIIFTYKNFYEPIFIVIVIGFRV